MYTCTWENMISCGFFLEPLNPRSAKSRAAAMAIGLWGLRPEAHVGKGKPCLVGKHVDI